MIKLRQKLSERKYFYCIACFLLITSGLLFFLPNFLHSKQHYNVVFILSDALRWDILGCYGGIAETPNIDWLAENGAVFENAYSTASQTEPSSVAIFTSNHQYSYYVRDKYPDLDHDFLVNEREELFSKILLKKGYDVRIVPENIPCFLSNNTQGFLEITEMPDPQEDQELFRITGLKHGKNSEFFKSLNYIFKAKPENPFFLYHWLSDPHTPYEDLPEMPAPPDSELQPDKITLTYARKSVDFSKHEIEFIRECYKKEVEYVDKRIGALIKLLEYKGIFDKTYIVLTGDHGKLMGEHGYLGHGFICYEHLIHVPLIFYGHDIPHGIRISNLVSHVDLMPTIADLIGFPLHYKIQGTSNKKLFFKKTEKPGTVFAGSNENIDTMLQGDYKLLILGNGQFNLYNIALDPMETKNLAEEMPEKARKMYSMISSMMDDCKDKMQENLRIIAENPVQLKKLNETLKHELKKSGYW